MSLASRICADFFAPESIEEENTWDHCAESNDDEYRRGVEDGMPTQVRRRIKSEQCPEDGDHGNG